MTTRQQAVWCPRYLTSVQAAEYLGINPQCLRHLVRQGKLPGMRLGPRRLRFLTEELDAAMAKLRPLPTRNRKPKPAAAPETLNA